MAYTPSPTPQLPSTPFCPTIIEEQMSSGNQPNGHRQPLSRNYISHHLNMFNLADNSQTLPTIK